jgi:hypothetical protein
VDPFGGLLMTSTLMSSLLILPYLLLGLGFPYIVLRLRDAQNRRPDPQLGFKAAMYFFYSIALFLILTALTIFVVDFLMELDTGGMLGGRRQGFQGFQGGRQREPFPNPTQRIALAILTSGAVFLVLHLVVILTLTKERGPSLARRTFLGWRLAVHGIVVMFGVTGLLVILFQKSDFPADELRRFFIGLLIVWLPSWFLHLVLLRVSSPTPTDPPRIDLGGEEL